MKYMSIYNNSAEIIINILTNTAINGINGTNGQLNLSFSYGLKLNLNLIINISINNNMNPIISK